MIDKQAVRIVHPDPNTAGGILETKKIGARYGVAFMHHHAASPVSFSGSLLKLKANGLF